MLFGLLGMLDIPVLIIVLALFVLPRGQQGQASVCEALDPGDFAPAKYESGLGGELADDTLFSAGTEYLIQQTLVVPKDQRLLIQPGARLVFDEGAALDVYGKLYVCGTQREPITFTSEEGEPGSWPGIQLHGSAEESIISHALIQFAGDRALYLDRSAPRLLDVKIANGTGFGISTDGNKMPDVSEGVELDDNPFNAVEIRSGTLDEENITWADQGLVYVVSGPLEVGVNTSLKIQPNVVVKFWHAPNGRTPGIGVRGLLEAEDVTFTSVYDSRDVAGGVTYREAQDPEAGDWAGVGFYESSSRSFLRRCLVQYAGEEQRGAVSMQRASPELADVTIVDTAWYPLSVDADSFPTLSNLTLKENNPGDALEVRGGSEVTGRNERTWEVLEGESQIVRVIRGDVTIGPEAALTIEPGVVVKFEEKGRLIVKGTLRAVGDDIESNPIVFTSLRDAYYGGDTDKTTGPQDNRNWRGIVFEEADENSVLEKCIVRYASITLDEASPRLIDNLIAESESAAIWASPGASPELRGNRLEDNAVNGLAIWKAKLETDQVWASVGEGDEQLVRVLAGEVTVEDGATLSIEPGTIIKFSADGKLRIVGGLRALGQESLPVLFTSLNDDSAGGDTNQRLQEADAGDWPGIEIRPEAQVHFRYAAIRYAKWGLTLHGDNVPSIDGWLRVSEGKNALWCESDIELPDSFRPEGNEVNEVKCPTD